MNDKNKKTLLIFDFDKTILDDDSYGHVILKTLTKEELQNIFNRRKENWVDGYNYSLKQIKSHGVSKDDFNKMLDELSLTEGMEDLFSFIKEKKGKYDSIILSCNYSYVINYILNKHNISDIFKEIICNPSREANPDETEQFIYVMKKKPHECNVCNPCACKNNEFKEFSSSHDMNEYDKIIFICDGFNDICLAKNLGKNDITLTRKDFAFQKNINENNLVKDFNCKVDFWENGNEIINYLKSLE